MPRAKRPEIHSMFLLSLAVAASACAGQTKSPDDPGGKGDVPDGGPTATATSTASPEEPPAKADPPDVAYAKEFEGIDSLGRALPKNVELLGFVDWDSEKVVCTPGPCPKAWVDAFTRAESHGAVVKRDGQLAVLLEPELLALIGAIDTPQKAALRARLNDWHSVATCQQFTDANLSCAMGAKPTSIPVRKTEQGYEVLTYGLRDVCGGSAHGQGKALGVLDVRTNGEVFPASNDFTRKIDQETLASQQVNCVYPTRGRMFEGFVDLALERTELEYYVRAARQETAAVAAFERLAAELRAHGAPEALVREALVSANDERRHAKAFRREATRLGARLGVDPIVPEPGAPAAFEHRSLEALLRENAVEGCTNETYAAVVATYQAERAPTPRLRKMLRAIAKDEQRHAMLAHRIHAWGVAHLTPEAAADIEALRRDASRAMHESPTVTAVGRAMGEPDAALALVAFDHVSEALARAA
jgi:rubrerythrin